VLLALLTTACADKSEGPREIAGADPERGREIAQRVGCAACHVTPGVAWPRGSAGPSLERFGRRPLIGGRFPNQPAELTQWVRDAPSMAPSTGMPAMPLTEAEARDVAAWLYTLE
jgi:sulfur-oxidizing protein SoxX